MNSVSQRNKLEVQLRNYKDYVPFCSADGLLKLIGEIAKIILRIENLRECPQSKQKENIPFYYETKQSKLNFKTI